MSHTHRILSWFDLRHHQPSTPPPPAPPIDFPPGQITLIQGPSGAGKSLLLRQLLRRARRHHRILDLAHIPLPRRPVVDIMARAMNGSTDDEPTTLRALEALSRVGLGEVWTYLRTPHQLSEGQRWRLKLALALETLSGGADILVCPETASQSAIPNPKSAIIVADEFTSLLDRLTARILARSLRKSLTTRPHLHALLATSHEDLTHALQPDRIIHCDFGSVEIRIPNPETNPNPPMSKMIKATG